MQRVEVRKSQIRWQPQPRQLKFLRACGLAHPFDNPESGKPRKPVATVIGYGGAAGGGKSDALMIVAILVALCFPGSNVGYFRRTFVQLQGPGGAIMRSMQLLTGVAKWNGSLHRWTFPNGSVIQFCYLNQDNDVHNYQSQQFDCICFDEATQFTWYMVSYMLTRLRATNDHIIQPFIAMATNPGNIGHFWFKKNFVLAGEPEMPHVVEVEPGKKRSHIFIPARLSDNKILEQRDPNYRKNLESQPEMIRRRLLEGDWDIAEGMAFEEWREDVHTCDPFEIPDTWTRFRSMDWGYSKPYCIGWYAIDHDGRMYKYRELYGWGGEDDKGSKEDPEEVARKIIKIETRSDGSREPIKYAVADDACFGGRQDRHKTIAEQFADAGVYWTPVGKGPGSRKSGKIEVHHRLKWEADNPYPLLVFFKWCRHTIRTLPMMMIDDDDPEDVDTDLEDHAYDETRYACMSRPLAPKPPKPAQTKQAAHKEKLIKSRQYNRTKRIT